MITNYYYNAQLKKAIIAFSNIFTGMQVKTGRSGCEDVESVVVPVRYGSSDRVVEAIASSHTQNKLHTLPMIATYMTGLSLDPTRIHGLGGVDRRAVLEAGGVFPDDVKSIHRVMPIPYNMELELAIYASNTDQLFQILEQVLILFDYDLQLQFNDAPFDWGKISKVILTGMTNEENHPAGVDRRMLVWSLTFEFHVWISPPMDVRAGLIREINVRLGNIDNLTLDEIDVNGDLVPFSEAYTIVTIPTIGEAVELGLDPDVTFGPSSVTLDPPDPGGVQEVHPGPEE